MNILFSKEHIWIKEEGGTATLGLSGYAQEKLGDVMFLNLPETGDIVTEGMKFGDIESIKTVSDLFSPVSGEVLAVNEELMDEPDMVNRAPYDAWFIKVNVTKTADHLLQEEEYGEYCRAQ